VGHRRQFRDGVLQGLMPIVFHPLVVRIQVVPQWDASDEFYLPHRHRRQIPQIPNPTFEVPVLVVVLDPVGVPEFMFIGLEVRVNNPEIGVVPVDLVHKCQEIGVDYLEIAIEYYLHFFWLAELERGSDYVEDWIHGFSVFYVEEPVAWEARLLY
jgi:hypothetical protein